MEPSVATTGNVRYKLVAKDKAAGATYTPSNLATFVARQILNVAKLERGKPLRLLDPATGDGELLTSLLGLLAERGVRGVEVHGFETDVAALNTATSRIRERFPDAVVHFQCGSFLDFVLEQARPGDRGGLFEPTSTPLYDLIIANPPYVRTQIMGAEQAQQLASQFGLAGRVDLYYAFVIAMAHVLRPGGIGGIIVSNRFMTTRSGAALRHAIRDHFTIRHVWDLGDTKLFDAAVLPAVLLVEKQQEPQDSTASFTSIYTTTEVATKNSRDALAAVECDDGVVAVDDGRRFKVKHGALDMTAPSDAVWRVANVASDSWLAAVAAHTWARFGDLGKIRVGVKTCADKIFIRSDWDSMSNEMRPELLRPITTHHIARRFRAKPGRESRHILYPHESVNGERKPSDLTRYPKSRAYLEQHRDTLEGRTYVIEGGRQWYEIWVPQDPASWDAPKLVFRDIAEEPTFWLDLDGSIVNGDCYWLAVQKPEDSELLWLAAAVANSTFIEAFYDHSFNNKLYAGRRRFITQYVEQFPLPEPSLPSSRNIMSMARALYDCAEGSEAVALARRLDKLIWQAFGVDPEKADGKGNL
jgi:methylase of polypeptide subunit release factors